MSTRMKFFVYSLVSGHTISGRSPRFTGNSPHWVQNNKRRCGCYRISPIQGAFVSPFLPGFFYSLISAPSLMAQGTGELTGTVTDPNWYPSGVCHGHDDQRRHWPCAACGHGNGRYL